MTSLSTAHASTELVAKNTVVDTVDDDSRPGVANVNVNAVLLYATGLWNLLKIIRTKKKAMQ